MIDIAGIVQQALGKETVAGGVRPVSGGDINDAYLVTLSDGQKVFLKVNTPRNAAFFSAEQEGLAAIRKTNAIGVPEVIATGVFTGDELQQAGLQAAALRQAGQKIALS